MGAIGTGAAAGGVAGGALAWLASRALPLPATVLGLVALGVLSASALAQTRARDTRPVVAPPSRLPASVLLRNPYLRSIAIVVLLGAVVEAIVDFLFKAEAADRFAAGSLLGAFAVFHAGISVLGLLLQAGAQPRPPCATWASPARSACAPPRPPRARSSARSFPGLATATLVRGAYESLTNSLFRSGYELLYTPLPEAEKRRVKAIVDVGVDKVGALAGSAVVALTLALAPLAAVARPVRRRGGRVPRARAVLAAPAARLRADARAEPRPGPGAPRRRGHRRPRHPGHPRRHQPRRPRHAAATDRGAPRQARPTRSLPRRWWRSRLLRTPSSGEPSGPDALLERLDLGALGRPGPRATGAAARPGARARARRLHPAPAVLGAALR